ncbi:ABC transporter permease subunit [Halomarina salina]|uniref:ABC transporter permease subunit n=1 Tax=Halomarina salina TaxID=1872699 RepID=A0ABD5RK91_9EURY|nr:ABC transporter permease subunit [Halomarina salina]
MSDAATGSVDDVERADRRERHTASARDVFRFEAERRLRVTAVVAAVLGLYAAMFVWIGPQLTGGEELQAFVEQLPPAMTALFGLEHIGSFEGILGEFYSIAWLVGLSGYVAYSAAGSVAGALRDDRMDTLLAAPISRTSVLLGKYAALLVPIVVLNVVVPVVLYVGSVVVDDPLSFVDLVTLHVLSIPFLLCWAAVGLFLGVLVRGGRRAGRLALGLVFAGWLVESVVVGSDFEWLGNASPMRYFEPTEILVDGSVDLLGTALLLAVAAVVLVASRTAFERSDL